MALTQSLFCLWFVPIQHAAQENTIVINMGDFADLPLPIQEGAITTVGVEWWQCILARQQVYGRESPLPDVWQPYMDPKGKGLW